MNQSGHEGERQGSSLEENLYLKNLHNINEALPPNFHGISLKIASQMRVKDSEKKKISSR